MKFPSSHGLGPTSKLVHSQYQLPPSLRLWRWNTKGLVPSNASGIFGCISPGSRPEPYARGIWLPLKALRLSVTTISPSDALPDFSNRQRLWDSGLQRVSPPFSRTGVFRRNMPSCSYPALTVFLPVYTKAVTSSLTSHGVSHTFAALCLPDPLPHKWPVPVSASDLLQGFEPSGDPLPFLGVFHPWTARSAPVLFPLEAFYSPEVPCP